MKKKSLPVTNIGTVSLMMMFIVLCMVTFSALSLTTASRDARLSQKMADRQTEYYTASNQAETLLAEIDDILASACQTASDEAEYYRIVQNSLRLSPAEAAWITENQEFEVSFQTSINDSQTLNVRLGVLPLQQIKDNDSGSFYKILSWQAVNTETWESDDTLQLIQ